MSQCQSMSMHESISVNECFEMMCVSAVCQRHSHRKSLRRLTRSHFPGIGPTATLKRVSSQTLLPHSSRPVVLKQVSGISV